MSRMKFTTALAALLMPAVFAADAAGEGSEEPGAALFARHCVHCHGDDAEATGTLQLARTRGQDKALLAGRQDLPPEYIQFVVRNGLKAMPGFLPSEITEPEVRVLADWLRRPAR